MKFYLPDWMSSNFTVFKVPIWTPSEADVSNRNMDKFRTGSVIGSNNLGVYEIEILSCSWKSVLSSQNVTE